MGGELRLPAGLDAALAGANRGAESEMRRVKGLLKTLPVFTNSVRSSCVVSAAWVISDVKEEREERDVYIEVGGVDGGHNFSAQECYRHADRYLEQIIKE